MRNLLVTLIAAAPFMMLSGIFVLSNCRLSRHAGLLISITAGTAYAVTFWVAAFLYEE